MTEAPPDFVALALGEGYVCVIPERVYVAGLRLGKTLKRQEARAQREPMAGGGHADVSV